VRALSVKERFLREERGFTLIEMSITIIIMMVMFLALHSVFEMSVKIFSAGNNKIEAVEGARVGLEKMEREIRQAYAYDREGRVGPSPGSQPHLFWDPVSAAHPPAFPAANSITFGNDLDGDRQIETDVATEQITYAVNGTTLQRNGQPAVESVQNATFVYLDANRNPVTSCAVNPPEGCIAMVRIVLVVAEDPGTNNEATQRLTTDIDLRNR
jgi:prepilin-type N-terminal cleavage/methylation domain-containing protein